jgi:sugar phosphate permease
MLFSSRIFISKRFLFFLIKETLRDWVHVFLIEKAQVDKNLAPAYSIIYPISGGLSSLFIGFLMDKFTKK